MAEGSPHLYGVFQALEYGGTQQVLYMPHKVQEKIRDFIQSWHPLTSRGEHISWLPWSQNCGAISGQPVAQDLACQRRLHHKGRREHQAHERVATLNKQGHRGRQRMDACARRRQELKATNGCQHVETVASESLEVQTNRCILQPFG